MLDTELLTWTLRALFIVGFCFVLGARKTILATQTRRGLNLSQNSSGILSTISKQHVNKCSERPLMTIRESIPSSAIQPYLNNSDRFPISRESLLSALTNSEGLLQHRLSWCKSSPYKLDQSEDKGNSKVTTIINPVDKDTREEERANLQSLLRFRVLKGAESFGDDWARWNSEARRILGAAEALSSRGISIEVREVLRSAGVLPDCDTYIALVRASMAASEGETAKTFLNEMGTSGYIVDPDMRRRVDLSVELPRKIQFNKNAAVFVPRH